jgi:REP element-mobilizing transposase RayT
MAVRRAVPERDGLYFITITCARWHHLFEITTDGYSVVYNWFDHLKAQGHFICGYVIMPNHLHALIAFRNKAKTINSIIGNGKRFMAYEFVQKLKDGKTDDLLSQLASYVNKTDKRRGKHHEIFEPSFDWKECYSKAFTNQKLNYIHENPCRGVWKLAASPQDYTHSSARFYILGTSGEYAVKLYSELQDEDLSGGSNNTQSPEAETLR